MRYFLAITLIFLTSCTLFAAEIQPAAIVNPDWLLTFNTIITNPNIAYLLLLIAIYGLFFELANPGLIAPGVTGIIALIFVLYAFHLIPVNYVGLMLILFGIGFMIAEMFVGSFGIIAIAGAIAFIIGSIFLFDTTNQAQHIAWPLILCMSILTLTLVFMILSLAIQSHKRKIVSGREGLIGSIGEVISVMNRQVIVRVHGEIWQAQSTHALELNSGDKIKVTQVNGLILTVEPLEKIRGK